MTSELGRRIAFTLGALLVYRIGSYIPLPGIDPSVWSQFFGANANGILGLFNLSSGGGIHRLAVFALGIMPCITAAMLLQLMMFVSPKLRALRYGGVVGRDRLVRYTFVLTVLLAVFQAYGIAKALEGVGGLVREPGLLFQLATTATLTAGTLFLVWLGDQITSRGVGNGIALLLTLGIIMDLPSAVAATLELGRQGVLTSGLIVAVLVVAVLVTGLVVFLELARRRLPVQFTARQVGTFEGSSHLSLKLNSAGIIPALFASWVVLLPMTIASFSGDQSGWWAAVLRMLGPGQPLFLVVYALAIVVGTFIYTSLVIDPSRAAETLDRHGCVIPGIAPGEATAEHIDDVVSRATMLGAVYLAVVCIIPELLVSYAPVPFYFGGAALLMVVCTVLDIDGQVRSEAETRIGLGGRCS